jgi:hypothetical protein
MVPALFIKVISASHQTSRESPLKVLMYELNNLFMSLIVIKIKSSTLMLSF